MKRVLYHPTDGLIINIEDYIPYEGDDNPLCKESCAVTFSLTYMVRKGTILLDIPCRSRFNVRFERVER